VLTEKDTGEYARSVKFVSKTILTAEDNPQDIIHIEQNVNMLTSTDVFLLDTGKRLFIWRGSEAENILAFIGLQTAQAINQMERNKEAQIFDLSHGSDQEETFWQIMNSKPMEITRQTRLFDVDVITYTYVELYTFCLLLS
jgi:hypothetical protein